MSRFIVAALAATCLIAPVHAQTPTNPLRIEQPWSRATPGGAQVAGGFLRVTNTGSAPDRLLGGATAVSNRIETHDMKIEDGVMKMRHLPQGIAIAPGETVELKPGGLHIMFMELKQGLKEGQSFDAVLQFEKAGAVPVTFTVQGVGARAPSPQQMHNMHGH